MAPAPDGTRRAVFLDRDGVLNVDKGYVFRIEDLELAPGAAEAVAELKRRGFLLLVVSNQSGIARGFYSVQDAERFNAALDARLRAHAGAGVDGFYICPHHPDGTVPAFTRVCACRKPAPGLIEEAARNHNVNLTRSFMVGDRPDDVAAALAAGVIPLQVTSTGHPTDSRATVHVTSLKDALPHLK